jgi:inner membrane protein COX18
MKEVGHLGPVVAERTLIKKMRKKRSEIYTRWDCGLWKSYLSFVQLPVWLVAIEAVRKMCGKEVGLLGMIFGSSAEGKDMPEALAGATLGSGKEISLATEGGLWFPDLLVPDPCLVLPFMLSGVIFANLFNSTTKTPSVGQRRLMNSMKMVALAIGPLTLQMPSAMLVYWISSSSFALGQALLLEKLMPVKPPVIPCKPRRRISSAGAQ